MEDKSINAGKVGLTMGGDWKSSESYEKLTCVSHNGRSWAAKKNVSAGVEPSAANSEFWQMMSDRGEQGIQGPVGPQGNSAYVKDGVVNKFELVNNLTQGGEAAALSAEQGKILKAELTELESEQGSIQGSGEININLIDNTYIDSENGAELNSGGWKSSDFINVSEVASIKVDWSAGAKYNMFYDSAKNPITKSGGWYFDTGANIYDVPQNAAYLRVSNADGAIDNLRMEVISYRTIELYNKVEEDIAEVTNTLLPKFGSETNEGLLNVEYIPRTYVDITNGELVEYAGYKSTDYINLGNVAKIKVKWSAGYQYNMFYDEQKKPIIKNGGWYFDSGENIYDVPQNAAYLRMSQNNGVMDGLSISVAEYRTMAIERKITEIPTYYDSYLVKKVEEINKVHLNSGRYNDSFVFITDTHWFKNQMMSPSLIKYIAEHTTCKKLLFGGDACGGELKDSPTIGREQAMKHMEVMSGIAQSVGVYQARGNHDFWGFSTSFVDANGLKNDAVANAIMFPLNHNIVRNDNSETNGCYYYFDVEYAKIRYVVLDLFDYIGKTDYSSWANNILHVITNEQKEWIANNALKNAPEGYSIVMMAHISPLAIMSEGYGYYAAVKQMIDAYNARQTWSGISFAESKGKVVCYVNGHQHQDIQAYSNGVCYVGTASDAYYTADISSCVFTQSANRESGSVTEQVLDVFNVDISNNIIDCVRVGCAYNRKMHLETVTKSVGQTYKIIPTIAAVKYGVYDNDAPTNTITNNHASISGNVVTCNSVGEVTCYAEDAEHNKEFFSIKIVA